MSQDKATLDSEETKPVALVIIKLKALVSVNRKKVLHIRKFKFGGYRFG